MRAPAALFLCLFLSACATHKQSVAQPPPIQGRLFNAVTKKPLSNFQVNLADMRKRSSPFGIVGPQTIGRGQSDRSGRFRVQVTDIPRYEGANAHNRLALLLIGDQPVVGIVGLQDGDSPTYYVDELPGIK